MIRKHPLTLTLIILLTLAITACSSLGTAQNNPATVITPQVIQQTVLVVITATPPAATPSATPAPQNTNAPAITSTPANLQPSPTPLLLLNVPVEGGDPNNKFYVRLVYPDYLPAATHSLWFRVYAHKPVTSQVDGEGIAQVDFIFLDSDGNQVYEHLEKTPGYCAFGGGEPDCTIWDFASHGYTWPDGTKILSGTYTLKVTATSKDNVDMFGEITINIQAS